MRILVAGGAGYIGTHTCVALLEQGHEVVVVDSLANSHRSALQRVEQIVRQKIEFHHADVRDQKSLEQIFSKRPVDAVIDFAGHKAVGESVHAPLEYYDNNLNCAIALMQAMIRFDVKLMVFSSSAAVYGELSDLPISENAALAPQNPYGRSKLYIEGMLRDLLSSDPTMRIAILRYFNPVGAHPSSLIGEQPGNRPGNLMPVVSMVAAGLLERVQVFGGDYDTPDGTAIRDYIHIMDLARGHVSALHRLQAAGETSALTVNLGTGRGYSVLELIKAFETTTGQRIPYEIVARRPGDAAICYADPTRANEELGWETELSIEAMCQHAWRWQCRLAELECGD